MRQGNQIDLRTQGGARQVTVTPGNSVQYTFNSQQSRIGASGGGSGLYNYVRGIMLECFVTLVRSGSSTTPLWADALPACIKSINLNSPMFGTMIDPTVMNGLVAKHLNDFVGNGYRQEGLNVIPVLPANGTYQTRFTLYIPFAKRWNRWPDHFTHWLGWLNDTTLEIFVEDNATPFAPFLNDGAVAITNVTFQATLDMVPWPEIIIPPYVVLRKYEQAAGATANGPMLVNVGSAGSLQGVEDASRLVGMYFSHQASGFVGSGVAADIASVTLGWRDQLVTNFVDAFFIRWLQTTHMRPLMGFDTSGTAASNGTDTAEPWGMPNGANDAGPVGPTIGSSSQLQTGAVRYTPFVWPETDAMISQMQKVKGNYPLDMTFGNAQSNIFRVYTHELKQYSLDKVSEMLASMGVDPSQVQLVPKLGFKNYKTQDPDKMWGLPRSVVGK